jgi:tetratricopeptide (TPR) repeat protein
MFKGKPRNVRDAGKQLNAEYILEGSVLRSGERLRVNTQLIRVRDDFAIWSGRFDRESTDIFAIQDEISRGVVNNLRLKLGQGRRRYEANHEAYDLYLRARANTRPGRAQMFEQVIAKDPSFALAWAALASLYANRSIQFAADHPPDELAKMRSTAAKAIQLDPLLAEAHDALGLVYARGGQWKEAEESFRRAIELAPNRSETMDHFVVRFLRVLGRNEEAVRILRTAEKADPLSLVIRGDMAGLLLDMRHYDEAAAICATLEQSDDFTKQCIARAHLGKGHTDEAIRTLSDSTNPLLRGFMGYALAIAGRREEAEKQAAGSTYANEQALIFAGLGDKDRTLEALDRMASLGAQRVGVFLNYPELALLQNDTRLKSFRRLSPDGSKLLYCTYLGGSGTDNGNDLAIDNQGNAFVTGATNSADFPTAAAEQAGFGGNFDAFVAKLSTDGKVIYSTYFGGSAEDRGNLISVDAKGNAAVSGRTASSDFPIKNGFQQTYGGGQFDAHVFRLNPEGRLLFSTYLGGTGADTGGKTAVDASGNLYLTGTTNSTDFPLLHAAQTSLGGGLCGSPSRLCYDAFVAKLGPDGSNLLYSTYFGGSGEENGIDGMGAIGLDPLGFVYVAGRTSSTDFPMINALQPAFGGGLFDNFAAKFSPDNSALIYSTYLGGSGDEAVYDIRVPSAGNLYVSGFTSSTDFPTANPLQAGYGGGTVDAFVSKLSEVPTDSIFYFAQAGGGGGFSTSIALSNFSTNQSANGTVSFFASDGRPLNAVVENSVTSFVIPPSRTLIIGTGGRGPLTSGYARVSSDTPLFANAVYSFAAGVKSLSVGPSSTGSVFTSPISRQSGGIDQGIALLNLTSTWLSVNLKLKDAGGNERVADIRLAAGEQLSRFLSELIPGIPNGFAGTLQITATPLLPFVGSEARQLAVTIVEFRPGQMNNVPVAVVR